MNRKSLFSFLSLLMIASVILSACGTLEEMCSWSDQVYDTQKNICMDRPGTGEGGQTSASLGIEDPESQLADNPLPVPEEGKPQAWVAMMGVADEPYQSKWDEYYIQWLAENCQSSLDLGGNSRLLLCPAALEQAAEDLIYEVDVSDAALLAALVTPWPVDEEVAGVIWAGDKISKILVVSGSTILARQGVVAFARHSDPEHDGRFFDAPKRAVEDLTWKVQRWFTDPKRTTPFLCGMALLKTGATQFRIFDIETGWTFFFQDGGWTSAFPGKTVETFLFGLPRGVAAYLAYNPNDPNDKGDALSACISILKQAPPPDAFK